MGKYQQHQNKLKQIILHLQKAFPKIRFFERHVGMFKTLHGNPIRINKPGMADLWGLYPTDYGLIHIEIEVKTGNARQNKDQKIWEQFITGMGGIYIVAREPEETKKRLESLLTKIPNAFSEK